MNTSRRKFMLGAGALGMVRVGSAAELFKGLGKPELKFGAISDTHITAESSTEYLRKTFMYFRDQKVDAVLVAGDITDHGILPQFENFAKTWDEVFPNGKRPDGEPVVPFFVNGNHDEHGINYNDKFMNKALAEHKLTRKEAVALCANKVGMANIWEKCFREKFSPVFSKKVKGYTFVGAHWTKGGPDWKKLNQWFDENGASLPKDKPFFYVQHPHLGGTVYGKIAWGRDNGTSTKLLKNYPNAVAFSGHSHWSLTSEQDLWIDGFVSVGTSSLSYACLPYGPVNYNEGKIRAALSRRQGMVVSVYKDRMIFVRRDCILEEDLDEAWEVPFPLKPASFEERAKACPIPQFEKDAKITCTEKKDDKGKLTSLSFTFPTALAVEKARVFNYEVFIEKRDANGTATPHKNLKLYPGYILRAKKYDTKEKEISSTFSKGRAPNLAAGTEYRVKVVPVNSLGGRGRELCTDWAKV